MRFALLISYDGTDFSGFQIQPDCRTVQGELEEALALLFRRPVDMVCAGRTDAGVHARGQVVSFEVDSDENGFMTEFTVEVHDTTDTMHTSMMESVITMPTIQPLPLLAFAGAAAAGAGAA